MPHEQLTQGAIYPARIIRRIDARHYVVEMHRRRFIVESILKFNTPEVFVQVLHLDC